ncbi:MAG TPA: chromosome segregation protein SMC [Candidatus Baltobacteraceae bacterium]|nr:chromosome segregation protein SMC [Candidatus Baltobacteraceae bacterium]
MLKLRKVELLGFKSFFEKTPITFSGSGITCIVGPNGCGKSNVVDAVSWVLGEQSHKMLRAERMSDCIFNGTAKRPPLGLAEVTLTLVDPELSEAVAKVIDGQIDATPEGNSETGHIEASDSSAAGDAVTPDSTEAPAEEATAETSGIKARKKRAAEKPVVSLRPGEVVVGRRLYRSGQSEYLINGRVARLRDVQEIFMGIGLGPDSYAIIEQGRIGQILNSKPMDRRAIIEEAAGVTMYKTKRRLAEAKLEASKINLARVNDILVEVEKQLASLKRQASKARRYAELREQMRGMLRIVLASKAEHLDIEAARLENLLRDMDAAEERESKSVHELEGEQERLSGRTYELDAELRQTQNLLSQTALDLDRAENRITFNREQAAQLASRAGQLAIEIEQAVRHAADLAGRVGVQKESVTALRSQAALLETSLREASENVSTRAADQSRLETRMEELRQLASRLVEESARQQAESLQAEEAAARHTAAEDVRASALMAFEQECLALEARLAGAENAFALASRQAQMTGEAVRDAQANLSSLRQNQQETSRQLERMRQELSAERARHASLEQILRERAYTADAVQKLFNAGGSPQSDVSRAGFRAVGLLADYTEVQEEYEAAIEQFLREELEYVVVESFDQARAGVALLRDEVGGRATFFVDSIGGLEIDRSETESPSSMPGNFIARLDKLVEFREPLGSATKFFLKKLRAAYLVEGAAVAELMAREHPHNYFLTPEGTCYHGRMVSGGRKGEAGPLALKRELRQHETEAARLEQSAAKQQLELSNIQEQIVAAEAHIASATAQQMEAEKSLVAATHQRDQVRNESHRANQQFAAEREEIASLRAEAEAARARAERARRQHAEALSSRASAEAESAAAAEAIANLRLDFQGLQEQVTARREALAAMAERLSSAEALEKRLGDEAALAGDRVNSLRQQHSSLIEEQVSIEESCEQIAQQAEELRKEKQRLDEQKTALEAEWEQARSRTSQIEDSLRGRRQSLDELRAERSQRQIEKARNDADRDYLRQTCVSELNAQPEELMAQEGNLLVGEDLIAAETNYNEMKARVEAMGPVNMMALEEFKECEEREGFLRREYDDLTQSIQNTQLTIAELDEVSRQKFEEAFQFINASFAVAFQSLFGGGHGEMRLSEPDSSGEAGIDIVAQPPGKRLQNILLLSGGEKALTALALLIAVFRYRPSPFCILDEVDAPLDEANVGRFNRMLADMCAQTQFIVVTHNRKTMEMGSVLYGVTMQEPGVSKLVSVKWEEDAAASSPAAAAATNAA